MIDLEVSEEAVENVMLPVTSFFMTGLVVVSDVVERHIHRRTHSAGAVGPGFLLAHNNAQPRGNSMHSHLT